LIARNFGTGVITATAFIHLLDPAYSEIGGWSCVGVTGNWAIYSWCPAIVMASVVIIFLVDLVASVYTERKFGIKEDHNDVVAAAILSGDQDRIEDLENRPHLHEGYNHDHQQPSQGKKADEDNVNTDVDSCSGNSLETERDFEAQFGAFLILEFGVLFHSVMIGLNLGTVGSEFKTLYPVLVFHQAFEGLGIGSRLSMIPFPYEKRWWPYFCCLAYGLTTPIAVSIGLGVRTTYASNSYTVNVISGVLDAISAGILIYTALVELLARDYIFNPHRTKDLRELGYCLFSVLLGTGLMALLGKWA
jgi:zinc transporter 1/2/3